MSAMDTSRCTVRQMAAADCAAVADLCTQLGYPANPDDISRRFDSIVDHGHSVVLVAEDGGRVVGWMHVGLLALLEADPYGLIMGLVVDEAHRSRGIGLALLEAGERWVRDAGYTVMRVHSRIIRERAHAFYERHGYTRLKTQHAFEKKLNR